MEQAEDRRKPERSGQDLVDSIRAIVEPLGGLELPEIVRGPMREPPNFESQITLRPTNLHWLEDFDEREDVCAHSGVDFSIDGQPLMTRESGDWTVSAAALYLLRTLAEPHRRKDLPGGQLFPCCANGLFVGNEGELVIVGCTSGIDFDVAHDGNEMIVTSEDGREYVVGAKEWRRAVCTFSDAVHEFYTSSAPKEPREDAPAFELFMAEWEHRRSLVRLE